MCDGKVSLTRTSTEPGSTGTQMDRIVVSVSSRCVV